MTSNFSDSGAIKEYNAKSINITIVVSEFNSRIIEGLLEGAINAFQQYGGNKNNCTVYRVPGAFEIPAAINQVLKYNKPNAIIAIGAIIKGETPHFDIVANESARGIAHISRNSDIPIINGIITTDTVLQAETRAQTGLVGANNKGRDALEAALHTIQTYKNIAAKL